MKVCPGPGGSVEESKALALRLGLPWVESRDEAEAMVLVRTADRWQLHLRAEKGEAHRQGWLRPIEVDFENLDISPGAGGRKDQPLARAVGLHRWSGAESLRILDTTAGFGEDGWILAGLGCEVTLLERNPVVFTLLEDGLKRAHAFSPETVSRIHCVHEDARDYLCLRKEMKWNVIYLDPMFPHREKSALEQKKMRALRSVVGEDPDAEKLLEIARRHAENRVVVKRPVRAEPISGSSSFSQAAKSLRYDVYLSGPDSD